MPRHPNGSSLSPRTLVWTPPSYISAFKAEQFIRFLWSKHYLSQRSFFLFLPATFFDCSPTGCDLSRLLLPTTSCVPSNAFSGSNICSVPQQKVTSPPLQASLQIKQVDLPGSVGVQRDLDSNENYSLAFETC